jgi:hypothetical protein
MLGTKSGRPSQTLAYLALAALGLQLLLGIAAPELAAWSPAHTHITIDGRPHAHTHAWDGAALGVSEAGENSQAESAPSYERGLAMAVALPAAFVLLAIAGAFFLAQTLASPITRGFAVVPTLPPPRG